MNDFVRKIPSGAVVFNDKKEVLMCKRISKKDFWHDKWEFPGGTIEFGEDPKNTAIRETKEETGADIEILSDFPLIMNYAHRSENEDYICIAYPAKYLGGDLSAMHDDGVSEVKWFKVSEIDFKKCLPLTKEILEKFSNYLN